MRLTSPLVVSEPIQGAPWLSGVYLDGTLAASSSVVLTLATLSTHSAYKATTQTAAYETNGASSRCGSFARELLAHRNSAGAISDGTRSSALGDNVVTVTLAVAGNDIQLTIANANTWPVTYTVSGTLQQGTP